MKNYAIAFALILFGVPSALFSQLNRGGIAFEDTVNLVTQTYPFPYFSGQNKENLIYSCNINAPAVKLNTIPRQFVYHSFPQKKVSFFIIPIVLADSAKVPSRNIYAALYEKKDSLWIVFDLNQNENFKDDDPKYIKSDEPYFARLAFGNITREFEYQVAVNGGEPVISLISLNYFELRYEINGALLRLFLSTSPLGTCFRLDTKDLDDGVTKVQLFKLGEAFEFAGKKIKISGFEPIMCKATISILDENALPYGYRKGYYVDKVTLDKLLGRTTKDYVLLYFWAIWCRPCLENMPTTKLIYEKITQTAQAEMIYAPVIVRSRDDATTKTFVTQNKLPEQYYQYFGLSNRSKEKVGDFQHAKDLIALFSISGYPTYVLIDKTGKILYNGEDANEVLGMVEKL